MHNELINRIADIFPMTEQEVELFSERISTKTFFKGEYLVREGDKLDKTFFIIEGCIREFIIQDGVEKSISFYTENQMISPAGEEDTSNQSTYFFESIEDSLIGIAQHRSDDEEFIKNHPRFEGLCRILTERALKQTKESLERFIKSNPLERYNIILQTRPDLIQRVSQKDLASYLGITPESLSRIRKRLASTG